jgi:hypothetical protein
MRSLVLGAFILASLGLTANAAESPSDAKAVRNARQPACHWVTADRTLKLLRDTLPGERRIATARPVVRLVSTPVKEPVVKVSRPAIRRVDAVRFVSRAEPIRAMTQHLSLMVGIGY